MIMEVLTACLMMIVSLIALGIGLGVGVKIMIFITELGENKND